MYKKLNLLIAWTLFATMSLFAQLDSVEVVYHWSDPSLPGSNAYNNTYNEVWGFVQNDHEFAVIGSTMGTHIFDITNIDSVYLAAFVEGALTGGQIVHRDYHDYNGYLYAVAGEGAYVSTLQIIDISNLPESYEIAYEGQEHFSMTHNMFIDTAKAKLYACAVVGIQENGNLDVGGMWVYSLEDPINPEFLYEYNTTVHDAYVRNDTAYLNCEGNGLFVLDFSNPTNPETIGALTQYPDQGYNHAGWLTDDGQHYFLTDENWGSPVKTLDVSDLSNIEFVTSFDAGYDPINIPHNAMVQGDYLFVSYYYDGLQVFDVSDPANPVKVREYNTCNIPHRSSYEGAWGVYTNLPSGHIIVSDMQEGLFIFDVNLPLKQLAMDTMAVDTMMIDTMDIDTMDIDTMDIDTMDIDTMDIDTMDIDTMDIDTMDIDTMDIDTMDIDTMGTAIQDLWLDQLKVYPSIFEDYLIIEHNLTALPEELELRLFDLQGRLLKQNKLPHQPNYKWTGLGDLQTGIYLLEIKLLGESRTLKLLKE